MQFNLLNFKGILFDFDGVIANTMEDNFIAWSAAFQNHNIMIDKDSYFILEGLKPHDVARHFLSVNDIDDKNVVSKIALDKENYYRQHNDFSLYEGVIELLQYLAANGKKLAIVTGASKERFFDTLQRHGVNNVLSYFDTIIAAGDYSRGKPNPEPYQMALNRLNLKSEDCIVVENAPLGIESAKNAGLPCIGLTTTLKKQNLKQADIHFSSISSLIEYQFVGDNK